ncbi:TPR domain protein [Cordyceps fumosorosea ARSEF 2679]|uniref:TPR domain protein n=1 Tax=Cordyceps fumosorosea (strain ARSEF 2679) TaxID=1081104 RepID=A0A162IBW6_CORFA|nr:TPR domain protein [Cordyceps fumosorosea ARSEF 2679]OAA54915.1 TPR domain protein [Cordyceps fumosorosea ARSEF 2679]
MEYYDLGTHSRSVTTASKEAQTWFDRGLVWSYGFNHEEAAKCFEHAIQADPKCAMAYWGLAYSLGPNYNKPWALFEADERASATQRTHDAMEKAAALAKETSPSLSLVEEGLIEALHFRYPQREAPSEAEDEEKTSIWNAAYADAMGAVAARFPDDLDVATLYADALMNLTPWALWDVRTGEPATSNGARTLEAKRVLDHALNLPGGRRHPGALHMYVHLMEIHIDVLVGDYAAAGRANTAAVAADEKFLAREGALQFYTLYRSHDYHFLLYGALFAGQSALALDTVARLEASISEELLRVRSPPMADWLEAFLGMRVHALVRFGRWDEVLALPLPADTALYCVTAALTHYAKGVAHAAQGRVGEARAEQALFEAARADVKPSRTLFNNTCTDILGVAAALLSGEVEYRAGNHEVAFTHLRAAIGLYDNLPYDEPWGWMQPVRHAYGALLLEQGRAEEALAVYRADLGLDDSLPRAHQHRNNVWALHGYHECLVTLRRKEEADTIAGQLEAALALADVPIRSSCFCRTIF